MLSPLRSFAKKSKTTYASNAYRTRSPSNTKMLMPVMVLAFLGLMLQTMWVSKNSDKFVDKRVAKVYAGVAEAEIVPVVCPYCEGQGLINRENKALESLCPICFGVGKNEVRILEEREMLCTACSGMGRRFVDQSAADCDACSGRGMVLAGKVRAVGEQRIEYMRIECEVCMGQGLIRHPDKPFKVVCPSCFGIGWNTARKIDEREAPCPACGGMGRIYEPETGLSRSCGRCGSRGLIEELQEAQL